MDNKNYYEGTPVWIELGRFGKDVEWTECKVSVVHTIHPSFEGDIDRVVVYIKHEEGTPPIPRPLSDCKFENPNK